MSEDPSLDIIIEMIEQSAAGGADNSALNRLLEKELSSLSSSMGPWNSSQCMLQDLGNFLHRTTKVVSSLANDIVHGDQVIQYARIRIRDMEKDTDFSELNHLEYLTDKHLLLKSFAEQLRRTVEQFEEKWNHSAKPPFGQDMDSDDTPTADITNGKLFRTSSGSSSGDDSTIRTISAFSASPTQALAEEPSFERYLERRQAEAAARHNTLQEESFEPQDDVHIHARSLIDSVSQRGTGNHTCPYGFNCTKGGVKDGKLLVFERNSAFRAHLQKHERMFVCDKPYCTAKGGFARIDQLRRHQAHVPHNKP